MRFSVVMPVYLKELSSSFELSLESILCKQTLRPDELIIIADGELTKSLYSVIDKYKLKYPSIVKVVQLDSNKGMGVAMNTGLECANYEWIARMDSDDVAMPQRFEKQMKFLLDNPEVDVLGSSIEEFKSEVGDLKRLKSVPLSNLEIIGQMKYRNPINHMTVVYRKSLAKKAGGYWKYKYYEDYNLWYEIYKLGGVFHNSSEELVNARVGNNMVSRRKGREYLKCEKRLYDKFLKDYFINKWQFFLIINLKRIARSLPTPALKLFYRFVLRN